MALLKKVLRSFGIRSSLGKNVFNAAPASLSRLFLSILVVIGWIQSRNICFLVTFQIVPFMYYILFLSNI